MGRLAKCAQHYLLVCEGDDDAVEQRRLRDLCSTLAKLLGRLLHDTEKWSRYYWVDDILPTLATTLSTGELSVQGLMVWGQHKQTQQWVEPFMCLVRVLKVSDKGVGYELKCGDAACGLGKVQYGTHSGQASRAFPDEWLFTFSDVKI
jgi:hypothetical protein